MTLAARRAELESTYRDIVAMRAGTRPRRGRPVRIDAGAIADRLRGGLTQDAVARGLEVSQSSVSRVAVSLGLARPARKRKRIEWPDIAGDDSRYVRICHRHRRRATFPRGGLVDEHALCPEGHPVYRWAVLDRRTGEMVAAGSAGRVVVGFDLERSLSGALEAVA